MLQLSKMPEFNEEKQNKKIEELHRKEEENLARVLSSKYGIPYIDLTPVPINQESLRAISKEKAQEARIGPFNLIDKKLSVGVISPKSEKTLAVIEELKEKGYNVSIYMVSKKSLDKIWKRYEDLSFSFQTKSGALDISSEEIVEFIGKTHDLESVAQLIKEVLEKDIGYRISRLLEIIIAGAISLKASDIHIEPQEDNIRLRYRLDGVLVDVLSFDNHTYKLLNSRIKLLSGLKLNVKEIAQDGRFSINIEKDEIEIRTSLLPGAYEESIVLRVLNPESISVPLEELGINQKLFSVIQKEIKKPNGMILTTGPTGSGKTTTLYAFLKRIYSPGVKIITIENPIEYHLEGIVQTQTEKDKGYTFLSGLRSALRQDPDVIMVGEIRDKETAKIAVNAALTGHLVFSTLHTNNAAGAIPRLIDLGVNSKVITSAINITLAQRLVRKLCPKCRKEVELQGEEKEKIQKVLDSISDPEYKKDLQTEKIWKPIGCKECNSTGYKGRIGVYEGILVDSSIEETVVSNPSDTEIRKISKKQNLLTMEQDGIIKVLKGITSLSELERVVDITENL